MVPKNIHVGAYFKLKCITIIIPAKIAPWAYQSLLRNSHRRCRCGQSVLWYTFLCKGSDCYR